MLCAKCKTENPDGLKFCNECGAAFQMLCASCGFENAPAAKFCGKCGAPLNAPASAPVSATPPVQIREVVGERRHLTVLFCDLVGSTAIAAQLDPEEWRETAAGYHRMATEAITRFDGHVAKYLGDGVMAYFGWPEAHDNDAERAARAGLAILDAITTLNEQSGHVKLSARVGIDSGAVVVGAGVGPEADVFGDTPNIAARAQSAAEPGTVAITDATHRLVSGLFVVEDCGTQTLKGIERPLQLYRVIRPSGVRGRFEAATAAGGLTPFVGREDELRSLMNRWERAREGEGQVALIIGEAGIGKSRLVQRFHEQIANTPHTWIEAGAGAFFQNTPFYLVSEMLRQFVGDAPIQDQLAQLATRLTASGLKPAEAIPLIAPLLSLPLSAEYPPSTLPPEQQRRRLLATLVEWVLGSARAQPLIVATEDLHWADPSTLELIQLLVEQGAGARLLLLYTARPEFRAQWAMRAHHTQITLNRLSARNVRTMVGEVAAQKALSDETIAVVVERTGGVPLFVEELTRAVLESGDAKLSSGAIPATLHDSLMARLDRLGEAKEVIQIGSIIGSDFSYELLHAVHPIPDEELQRALRTLTDAELLYVRGIAPEATYQFKHALIRDAAYEALLKSRRKELHRQVAHTIDAKFTLLKETHPEVLAHHWTEAGDGESAIPAWRTAGDHALDRGALMEAESHYRHALEVLNSTPETLSRDQSELRLQLALGEVLLATKGYGAPEKEASFERAKNLAEKLDAVPELVSVLRGQFSSVLLREEIQSAQAIAQQILAMAERYSDPAAVVLGHYFSGLVDFYRVDLADALKHFMQAISLNKEKYSQHTTQDPGIEAHIHLGPTTLQLGMPDTARNHSIQAIALAERLGKPLEVAFGRYWAAAGCVILRDPSGAEKFARSIVEQTDEARIAFFASLAGILLGWCHAQQGQSDEGIRIIREHLAEYRATRGRLMSNLFLGLLAEAQGGAESLDEALTSVEEALTVAPDQQIFSPYLLWLRGELRLKNNSEQGAEEDFKEAIACARRTGGKLYELRATTSLARLFASQGSRDDARTMLAETYNWFTEGFDTADLKDAKALLDDLAG